MSTEAIEQAVEAAVDDAGGAVAEAAEAAVEAEGEVEEQKGKPSKAKAQAHKFSELRKMQRQMRDFQAQVERAQQERDQERAERQRERQEFEGWKESLRRDYAGVLQRDLGVPREELLAQQTDEANLDPRIRRELIEMRQAREEDRKAWRQEIHALREERERERFEISVQSDVEKTMKLVDESVHDAFASLPQKAQADMIEDAVRRAVASGRAKHLSRAILLEELNDSVEEMVTHIRGSRRAVRAVEESRVAEEQPKSPTRAVGARGKAAPSASGPMTDEERRQYAIQRLREKRLKRESEALEKQRQKAAKSG